MNWGDIITRIMIGEQVLISIAYIMQGDVGKSMYWVGAIILTIGVLKMN